MTREAVLVPGLWVPALALAVLARRLARRGYRPCLFDYRGRGAFEQSLAALAAFARARLGERPAHFVGHSLGGVLVLETLTRHRDIPVASAVLLGAPVRGSLAGRRLAHWRAGRWMMGESAPRWAERPARWTRPEPLGVVAGTLALGLGRALGPLPGENDGVVCVQETAVEGMAARALVPEGHSMLVVSSRVAALTVRFFERGSFD